MNTRALFLAILFVALFVMATREITDPDFWWHLRTGEHIAQTLSVPKTDIFSHTNAGKRWVAHEWLSEIFIYSLYALGSFPALILMFSALITLAFALVYHRSEGNPFVAGFAVLLAAIASAPTWGVRPQMITLLLASLFIFILNRPTLAWLLVPLMIIWVNVHSGFMLGIAILASVLFGELIEPFLRSPALSSSTPRPFSHSPRTLILLLSACLAVVPLNPNGTAMYVYPFETLTSRAMQTYIQEWFSPDFHEMHFQPFAILLVGTLASFSISRRRVSVAELVLLLGFAYASLRSARHIPIFAIVAAPILARNVWDYILSRGWGEHFEFRSSQTRGARVLNWVLILLIAGAGIFQISRVIENQSRAEQAKFPTAAVDFLRPHPQKGELFNSYVWGGYLIWRLYPPTRVFIDGRADVHGDDFMEDFLRAYRAEPGWEKTLERYKVGTVLIEPNAPLAHQLATQVMWKNIYTDTLAVVFERK